MTEEDDVSTDELAKHVGILHKCRAKFVEAVEVKEVTAQGGVVWEGAVKVFDLSGHPKARRAYGWSYPTEGGKRQFVAVLGLPPVDGPVMAVRAYILAGEKKKN